MLILAATGCGQESEKPDMTALQPTVEAARQDPEATVRLFYDFFIQKEYGATEALVTRELADSMTDNGQRSYAEVQRRQDNTVGHISRYEILAVRYPDPTTAYVDINIYRTSAKPSERTTILTKGPQGWQINGGRWRDIVP
jgi:hypothetical protein